MAVPPFALHELADAGRIARALRQPARGHEELAFAHLLQRRGLPLAQLAVGHGLAQLGQSPALRVALPAVAVIADVARLVALVLALDGAVLVEPTEPAGHLLPTRVLKA